MACRGNVWRAFRTVWRAGQPRARESAMTSDGGAESRDGGVGAARGSASHVVLVDGSNVAHSSEGEQPSLADIVAVCDKLRGEGYEPVVVVDAALRHQID